MKTIINFTALCLQTNEKRKGKREKRKKEEGKGQSDARFLNFVI